MLWGSLCGKALGMHSCVWEFLHLTPPPIPGLSYQELQLLRGNCQNLLCSLIEWSRWLFFLSPSPCWNLLEPVLSMRFSSYYTCRVFEILSRLLAVGAGKGDLYLWTWYLWWHLKKKKQCYDFTEVEFMILYTIKTVSVFLLANSKVSTFQSRSPFFPSTLISSTSTVMQLQM